MTESVSDLIHKWNEQRLDLFAISQPNSDTGEFHGVIRFYHKENGLKPLPKPGWVTKFALNLTGLGWDYFRTTKKDQGEKVATKCIRVSSTASTQDVIETLREKFRSGQLGTRGHPGINL